MGVELIEDKGRWDRFIDDSPYGLLFHKWDFLKIIEKHTGYQLLPYGISKGDSLFCLFPLYLKKIRGLKTLFSPPPRTGVPYLGWVMSREYAAVKQNKKEKFLDIVAGAVEQEIKKISPNYISVSIIPNFQDVRCFQWNNYQINASFSYVLDLNCSLDEICSNFKSETRRKIRRAERLHSFQITRGEDLSILYALLEERYREQGLNIPLVTRYYLEDLLRAYPEHIGLYYLYDEGQGMDKPQGVHLTHEYKRFIGWMGNTRTQDNLGGNEYMIWSLIQKAKSKGFQKFELTGANIKNHCQFKSQFNPDLEVCFQLLKTDLRGRFAEWVYLNLVKRRLLHG